MTQVSTIVTLDNIKEAHERIKPHVHRTPLLTSHCLNDMTVDADAEEGDSQLKNNKKQLYLKCENFNKIGAFKIRGATNAVLQLLKSPPQQSHSTGGECRHVCTHSSGNHAQALALAAKMFQLNAHIIMPENAPIVKRNAVELTYGAKVYLSGNSQQSREETCERVIQETGAHFIHPYDNDHVIAGQGTVLLEMLEQLREETGDPEATFDAIICPVGGGGLMSGVSIASRGLLGDSVKIFGVEPEKANDAQRSMQKGCIVENEQPPQTICDGLKTNLKPRTWQYINQNVDQIFSVSDEEVTRAMKLVFERMKIVIEPSSATVVAAALFHPELRQMSLSRIGLVISGGNCDLDHLPWLN